MLIIPMKIFIISMAVSANEKASNLGVCLDILKEPIHYETWDFVFKQAIQFVELKTLLTDRVRLWYLSQCITWSNVVLNKGLDDVWNLWANGKEQYVQ